MTHQTDYYGNKVKIPTLGTKVLRDGYPFTVTNFYPNHDICIIASIELKGEGGTVEVGYYDFLKHKPVK